MAVFCLVANGASADKYNLQVPAMPQSVPMYNFDIPQAPPATINMQKDLFGIEPGALKYNNMEWFKRLPDMEIGYPPLQGGEDKQQLYFELKFNLVTP